MSRAAITEIPAGTLEAIQLAMTQMKPPVVTLVVIPAVVPVGTLVVIPAIIPGVTRVVIPVVTLEATRAAIPVAMTQMKVPVETLAVIPAIIPVVTLVVIPAIIPVETLAVIPGAMLEATQAVIPGVPGRAVRMKALMAVKVAAKVAASRRSRSAISHPAIPQTHIRSQLVHQLSQRTFEIMEIRSAHVTFHHHHHLRHLHPARDPVRGQFRRL